MCQANKNSNVNFKQTVIVRAECPSEAIFFMMTELVEQLRTIINNRAYNPVDKMLRRMSILIIHQTLKLSFKISF